MQALENEAINVPHPSSSNTWTISIFPQFFFQLNMKYNSVTLRDNLFFIKI